MITDIPYRGNAILEKTQLLLRRTVPESEYDLFIIPVSDLAAVLRAVEHLYLIKMQYFHIIYAPDYTVGEGGGASGPVGEGGGASGPTARYVGEGGGASGPVGEGGGASGPTATAILKTRSVPNMHASSFFILLSFPDNLKFLESLP